MSMKCSRSAHARPVALAPTSAGMNSEKSSSWWGEVDLDRPVLPVPKLDDMDVLDITPYMIMPMDGGIRNAMSEALMISASTKESL